MNSGLYPMLQRFKAFSHDWERPYLEESRDRVFKNTFADIERILTTCIDNGARFEIECYDIGHLYTLAHFVDRGLIEPPIFVQSVFGILVGFGPHPEDVMHMRRTADRRFGNDYHWSALGAGRNQKRRYRQGLCLKPAALVWTIHLLETGRSQGARNGPRFNQGSLPRLFVRRLCVSRRAARKRIKPQGVVRWRPAQGSDEAYG